MTNIYWLGVASCAKKKKGQRAFRCSVRIVLHTAQIMIFRRRNDISKQVPSAYAVGVIQRNGVVFVIRVENVNTLQTESGSVLDQIRRMAPVYYVNPCLDVTTASIGAACVPTEKTIQSSQCGR